VFGTFGWMALVLVLDVSVAALIGLLIFLGRDGGAGRSKP
jgi:hypothetical protein